MIIGIFLRNYKIYKNQNYIPISNSYHFSSLIGENGVGKSSILEALDSYFHQKEWNYHHSINKGFQHREPYICPLFLIPKSAIRSTRNIYKSLEIISDITWQVEKDDFATANQHLAEEFNLHIDMIKNEGPSDETHFLFPLGIQKNSKTSAEHSISIFSNIPDYQDRVRDELEKELDSCLDEIEDFVLSEYYRYIYIPSEINHEEFTKIEGQTVQALMGQSIDDIVKGFIEEQQIKEINTKLNSFMETVSADLENYTYKKPSKKQNLFNQSHLASKIIEAYFDAKVLNKSTGAKNEFTPVYNLSSGEKRKAIIDIAKAFLLKSKARSSEQIILAIDEPEISLDTASCFGQFEKLKEISTRNIQTLITTHWYGFMPTVSYGTAVYIPPQDDEMPHLIDLRCFLDDIKRLREKSRGRLPSDIELKGMNELIHSIIASITGESLKWIICEGASDKIYLDHYVSSNNIHVLPAGAAKNVKKIYKYLVMALEDNKSEINGKVFLMLDTDKQFESFSAKDSIPKIRIRRLLNDRASQRTKLVKTTDTNAYPPTEIEDTLAALPFSEALRHLASITPGIPEEINEFQIINPESPSGICFDLKESEKEHLENFFDIKEMKIKFSLEYISRSDPSQPPYWIQEIINYLNE